MEVEMDGTHLRVVAHAYLRSPSLAHYTSSQSSCPVESEEASGGIDGPSSALESARRTKGEAVSSRAGFTACRRRIYADPGSDSMSYTAHTSTFSSNCRASEMAVGRHSQKRATGEAHNRRCVERERRMARKESPGHWRKVRAMGMLARRRSQTTRSSARCVHTAISGTRSSSSRKDLPISSSDAPLRQRTACLDAGELTGLRRA